MEKSRLEAFSDGVLAIIITIMVLELKVPNSEDWNSLIQLKDIFLSYMLSFLFIGIYWGNHHHLLHTAKRVNASIIWANMFLLFCLSLIPFGTAWMGKNHFSTHTVIAYAILLVLCSLAFRLLQYSIIESHDHEVLLKEALHKSSKKGNITLCAYIAAIPTAFYNPIISCFIFLAMSVVWLIPEKNIETALKSNDKYFNR